MLTTEIAYFIGGGADQARDAVHVKTRLDPPQHWQDTQGNSQQGQG